MPRSETFGRLLKGAINSIATYEGKTAPAIEEELGQQIGVAGASIQRYKAGHIPPDPHTIAVFATAAVRRGYLNRTWLQHFLSAARYPTPAPLLDQLCPVFDTPARPSRVYHNLPAPTYSQFVMRTQAYAEVLDGLQQRSSAVLIASLGGMGKTSLAREIAAYCLHAENAAPRFDAVVWVSDKDRPGTTTLSMVLDEVARTLDYPGFTQYEHEEKRREVEQLLRRQRVLLVVDNFETIGDAALLQWLLRLPEPSKALITSREYRRDFRRGGWPVELRGMTDDEAQALITQKLRQLRIDRLVGTATQLAPLVAATGGNPKAIEIALGCIKYERRPLQDVVDDLYAARGELFDDLFTRSWALLDEAARRVLLAMPLFPDSASAEALSTSADVRGFAFERAVERLTDLALLDVQQSDLSSPPRYALHSLVRAFARSQLSAEAGFAAGARERWVGYYDTFVRAHTAGSWHEPHQHNLDRQEQELTNLYAVIQHCADTQNWDVLIEIVFRLNRLWSVRGYYEDRNRFALLAFQAAEWQGKINEQIGLLCIRARTLCYLDEPHQALACCEQARGLLAALSEGETRHEQNINYSQIRAYALLKNYAPIGELAQRNVALSESLYLKNMYHYDLAAYYQQIGDHAAATAMLQTLLAVSAQLNDRRGTLQGSLIMARIGLEREDRELAEAHLRTAEACASELRHRRLSAEVMRLWARLHTLCGDVAMARTALSAATDLFERLGMRHELAEARAELRQLVDAV